MLLSELPRSGIQRLLINSDTAAIAATARARAAWAAAFAGVRGDLWAESAFTYATLLSPGPAPDAGPSTIANHARTVIQRALACAPLQIRRLASRREARIPIQLDERKSHRHPRDAQCAFCPAARQAIACGPNFGLCGQYDYHRATH
jgi:hypothetical protein